MMVGWSKLLCLYSIHKTLVHKCLSDVSFLSYKKQTNKKTILPSATTTDAVARVSFRPLIPAGPRRTETCCFSAYQWAQIRNEKDVAEINVATRCRYTWSLSVRRWWTWTVKPVLFTHRGSTYWLGFSSGPFETSARWWREGVCGRDIVRSRRQRSQRACSLLCLSTVQQGAGSPVWRRDGDCDDWYSSRKIAYIHGGAQEVDVSVKRVCFCVVFFNFSVRFCTFLFHSGHS